MVAVGICEVVLMKTIHDLPADPFGGRGDIPAARQQQDGALNIFYHNLRFRMTGIFEDFLIIKRCVRLPFQKQAAQHS